MVSLPIIIYFYYIALSLSRWLGTTKFMNLIGWNGYWPRSRFSHLTGNVSKWKSCKVKCKIIDCFHLKIFISVRAKELMRKKVKIRGRENFRLIAVRKQNVSKYNPVSWNELNCSFFLPYNKHLINRAKSVCMGESWPRSCAHKSLRSVCTYDLGQDSPIQTSCSVNKS